MSRRELGLAVLLICEIVSQSRLLPIGRCEALLYTARSIVSAIQALRLLPSVLAIAFAAL